MEMGYGDDARFAGTRDLLLHRAVDILGLERDGSGRGWVCPVCGSGSGPHGTGLTSDDGIHFSCWGNGSCFKRADVFRILGVLHGTSSFREQFAIACRIAGVDDPIGERRKDLSFSTGRTSAGADMAGGMAERVVPEDRDLSSYFRECEARLQDTDYHRGIRLSTLRRFHVGFDPSWTNPKGKGTYHSPRLIVPTGKGSYLARDTRSGLDEVQARYAKQKVGRTELFNLEALDGDGIVFLVEGEIDALSVEDCGFHAVGLGSTAMARRFCEHVERRRPACRIVLALDDDESGRNASASIRERLEGAGISCFESHPFLGCKDANEALVKDREALAASLASVDPEKAYLASSAGASYVSPLSRPRTMPVPTGSKALDGLLGGGFIPSDLVLVGGMTGLGKTTLLLQMASRMAWTGRDVLFFSLEMPAMQVHAKNVSRISMERRLAKGEGPAFTAKDIILSEIREEDMAVFRACEEEYRSQGSRLFIRTGAEASRVSGIKAAVGRHEDATGKVPVVFIDYLQHILPEPGARPGDQRQATDTALLALHALAKEHDTPVIVASSIARDAYMSPISISCFKETGLAEFEADCAIGLELDGWDWADKDATQRPARLSKLMSSYRKGTEEGGSGRIRLKLLKSRLGTPGDVLLDFWAKYGLFTDVPVAGAIPADGYLDAYAGN